MQLQPPAKDNGVTLFISIDPRANKCGPTLPSSPFPTLSFSANFNPVSPLFDSLYIKFRRRKEREALSLYFTSNCYLDRLSILQKRINLIGESLEIMGEAPAFVVDDFKSNFSNGFHLKSMGCETAVNIGCNRTYVIGHSENESLGVRLFDKSTNEWVIPIVLGTKPRPSRGHSAIVLDQDRILVIKGNTTSDDSFWFLEVNTAFTRKQKTRLGSEVVAWSKGVVGEAEKPIVISGPSGVGKGTLIARLMEEFPSMFGFSVSHTTRAPRKNEKNGVHYHFTERSIMERDIDDGKFLEFAAVHGNLYGTSVEAVDVVAEKGKRCILDIDVQGARSVRASSLEAIFIFICPPSFEELEKRLRARGTEIEEQIQKRLRNAKAELEEGMSPGLFDHILVNDDLEACYEKLKVLLGLAGGVKTTQKPEWLGVPGWKIDEKMVITSGEERFVVDLSSVRGGAPGRTRGITINAAPTLSCFYE